MIDPITLWASIGLVKGLHMMLNDEDETEEAKPDPNIGTTVQIYPSYEEEADQHFD